MYDLDLKRCHFGPFEGRSMSSMVVRGLYGGKFVGAGEKMD